MRETLLKFVNDGLCEASLALLDKLGIKYTRGAEKPLEKKDLFTDKTLSKAAIEALDFVTGTYFVALIDERTFENNPNNVALSSAIDKAKDEKYNGMFVFAVDVQPEANITRTIAATITRAFNKLAVNKPVVLIIRQSDMLSIATCERSNYAQTWREGEKIGKVSVLKNINCNKPHRGHIDILNMLQAPTACNTFKLLYEHWIEVFSTELLTKKFYTELSDWYAWAVQVMRFPNDLNNNSDDKKFNAENGIRLVTRLIFVWFLKQRKLVPDEFFDENALKRIIKDFDPTQKEHSLFGYMSRESKYYKAILQNLFFAMLNCPLTEDGKKELNVRGFRKYDEAGKATGSNRGDTKLMRYKYYFEDPDAFVEMANRVPFLNGGLFDCLDNPDQSIYLDGFSDNEKVRNCLCVPDYLFFGESEDIDLSEWYDDKHKKKEKVRGIIDILKSYQFTIEENTPYEQEVSLDPELLGKVFENLLASYNPETNMTARKSTGSYYTPREIVQYMVNESLVAYLKEKVGGNFEKQYRQLLDYSEAEIKLEPEQKQQIMLALYQSKILDPACGSGAFPMGMLQQMVHILSQLDPDNTSWKKLVLEKSAEELSKSLDYSEAERKELQADINRSFDLGQNHPDYARKLYLIENCIYGVDIQTIAIQISKLRCFITLVVNQKINSDPADNYGIRPLPNLEARFVAANSLIGLGKDLSLANTEKVQNIKEKLTDANHRVFNAKTMRTKRNWKNKIKTYREELCNALNETGLITTDEATMIASWDMFNQNMSSVFFDPDWMFGVSNGFDIVIGNPPYVVQKKGNYPMYEWNTDLYKMFFEVAIKHYMNEKAYICYITPKFYMVNLDDEPMRKFFMTKMNIEFLSYCNPFDVVTENVITLMCKQKYNQTIVKIYRENEEQKVFEEELPLDLTRMANFSHNEWITGLKTEDLTILIKMASKTILKDISTSKRGAEISKKVIRATSSGIESLIGEDVRRYVVLWNNTYIDRTHKEYNRLNTFFSNKLLYLRRVDSCLEATVSEKIYGFNKNIYGIKINNTQKYSLKYILSLINSKALNYYYKKKFSTKKDGVFPEIQTYLYEQLPIPTNNVPQQTIVYFVDKILDAKKSNPQADTTILERKIDILVYLLYGLTWDEVQIVENSMIQAEENDGKKKKGKKKAQSSPMPKLNIDEATYCGWLDRYQNDGTLPSEEEMASLY